MATSDEPGVTEAQLVNTESWVRAHLGLWARETCGADSLGRYTLNLIAEIHRLRAQLATCPSTDGERNTPPRGGQE